MEKFIFPKPSISSPLMNFRGNPKRNISRIDVSSGYYYEPTTTSISNRLSADFPKDFFPSLAKKYSSPPPPPPPTPVIYKHIYLPAPEVPKTKVKKVCEEEDDEDYHWHKFDLFHHDDYEDEEECYESEGEEHVVKKKSKSKKSKKKSKKKKILKILLKILIIGLVLFGIKCVITKLLYYFPIFFATTGRDELDQDKDQLYIEGIDIDRAGHLAAAQNISMEFNSVFSPDFDETEIKYVPIKTIGNIGQS